MAQQAPLIETPQDVLRRLQAQRQQAMASNNPLLTQQAVLGNAFDAIFGNPEVKRARALQERVGKAVSQIPADAPPLARERAQLGAMYDAYIAQGDVANAGAVNSQLVQLQQLELEQRKLKAEARKSEQDVEGFDLEQLKKKGEANEYENWINLETRKQMAIHEANLDAKEAAAGMGFTMMGKTTIQDTREGLLSFTKPVITDLQTAMLGAKEQQSNLRAANGLYDPSFSTWGTQILNAGLTGLEKLGGDIPANQKSNYAQYVQWRSRALDNANKYVKFITGAQMSQFEIKRILAVVPTPQDGHTQHINKLRSMMRIGLQAEKRAAVALQHGMQDKSGDEIAGVLGPLEQFDISEAEIDAALGFSGQQANTPAADSNVPTIDELVKKYTR